ncbi:MAG: KTSC domain-containing protein [archaeon]|nr:KTSC domain-containing protein [archaeon]
MPYITGKDKEGCWIKWGESGKKYHYTCSDEQSRKTAKEKAQKQAIAITISENFETYNDYPQAATENAKIALRWAEENGWGSCGTPVGKARANQLANRENISKETIARMASFERHRQNSQKELGDGCGRLMWLAWGGDEGIEWAQRKLKKIKEDFKQYIERPNSTNVRAMKWDSETKELVVAFKEGGTYTYYNISEKIWNNIEEGQAGTKTAGKWGPKGKYPSVGASIHQWLKDRGIRYTRGGII